MIFRGSGAMTAATAKAIERGAETTLVNGFSTVQVECPQCGKQFRIGLDTYRFKFADRLVRRQLRNHLTIGCPNQPNNDRRFLV